MPKTMLTSFAVAAEAGGRILTGVYTCDPPGIHLADRVEGRTPCLAPSGWVYFLGKGQCLARLHFASGVIESLPGLPPLMDCSLSLDGRRIVAMAMDCRCPGRLVGIDPERLTVTALAPDTIGHYDPAPGPDGCVVLAGLSWSDPGLSVWKQGRVRDVVPLTHGQDREPAFSPDGRFLVYIRDDEGHGWGLWRLDWPPVSAPRCLKRFAWEIRNPTVTPDASHVIFFSDRQTCAVDVSGGSYVTLEQKASAMSLASCVATPPSLVLGIEEGDNSLQIGGLKLELCKEVNQP